MGKKKKWLEEEVCLDYSPLDFEEKPELNDLIFRKSPYNLDIYSRIDDLKSFAVLGLDIKLPSQNDLKIIEVNGIQTGMNGFQEAGVQLEDGLDLLNFTENPCEEALKRHIQSLGEIPINFISKKLRQLGEDPYRFELEGTKDKPIFYEVLKDIHPGWDSRYGNHAKILKNIELILKDKLKTDFFFNNCRHLKSKTYEYNPEEYQKLITLEKPKFVVIKPYDGARGENVEIFSADSKLEQRPVYSFDLVAESFVHSKPILSKTDNKYHDGCMRYVVFAEEDKKGEITFNHFGGYWRLCPSPISNSLDIDAMRANLAQGAIPEKVSKEDLSFVRKTIDSQLPIFYKNLVEKQPQ
ncbi:MAG: hypothetical protein Q7S33_01060 [Nanoarchaeota archaeon]|nr:hypothetical protein [Nanoarchaeota archaeon]